MPEIFDPWDSATQTELVSRLLETALESDNLVGPTIAPLTPTRDRRVKRGVVEVEAFGKGQVKARGAAPPIFVPTVAYDEAWIELFDLDEMSPVEEDEWEKLTGDNQYQKLTVGADLLQRQRILQIRNERATEYYRWQAFQDNLVVTLAESGGQQGRVTYGLPSGHKPTAGTYWSDRVNSTVVTNVRAWQKQLFTELGFWGSRIYMGADTWEDLQYSAQIKNMLKPNSSGSDFTIPTVAQVESLLYGGANSPDRPRPGMPQPTIVVTNAGYRDSGQGTARGANAMTYYLPEGYVMITTEAVIGGERIAEVLDGRVATQVPGQFEIQFNEPGFRAETMVDVFSKTHYVRAASKRIPRINIPAAFIWAKVWNV